MEIDIRNPWHPEDAKHYTTERIRKDFLVQELFTPDKIRMVAYAALYPASAGLHADG